VDQPTQGPWTLAGIIEYPVISLSLVNENVVDTAT